MKPLREVCRQDTEFQLTKSVRVAFLKTKDEISKNVTLPYFNPRSDTTLQTDASKKGLGAVILQDSKPVMFASRALTGAEKNYQNLERECLATIWGMEKFHYFLYGKHFMLETDQKPLASIYKKHMVDISPRIQRLVVRSFPYQPFDVQYRRGKDIPLADALSRVSPTPVEEDGIQLPIVAVNLITSSVPVSSSEIEMIREETARDTTLNLLRHYIHVGWPVDRRMLPRRTSHFLELQRRSLHGKQTHYQRGQTCDTLHIKKQGVWSRYTKDIWALKSVCSKQETQCFGPEFPMISGRLWRNVASVRPAPSHPSRLEM